MSQNNFTKISRDVLAKDNFYKFYGGRDHVLYRLVNHNFDAFKSWMDSDVDVNDIPEIVDVVINSEKFEYAEELMSRLNSESLRQLKHALVHLVHGEFLEAYDIYQEIDESALEYPLAFYNGFGYCQAALGDIDSASECLNQASSLPKNKRISEALGSYNTAMLQAFLAYAQGNYLVATVNYSDLIDRMMQFGDLSDFRLNQAKQMLGKCFLFSGEYDFANNAFTEVCVNLQKSVDMYNYLCKDNASALDAADLFWEHSDRDICITSLKDYIRNGNNQFWTDVPRIILAYFEGDNAALKEIRSRYEESYGSGFYRIKIINNML